MDCGFIVTDKELIDTMILQSPDGFNHGLSGVLKALGFEPKSLEIRGCNLTAFIDGYGEQTPKPAWAETMVQTIGGRVFMDFEQHDGHYWRWSYSVDVANLMACAHVANAAKGEKP